MLTYFAESDDIKMDVQVGPQEEVEAKVEGEDFCERCGNPVDDAKKNPETVPVGCCINKQTGVKEFYVDIKDAAKLAELNEMTLLEALDEIIDVYEGSDMCADNIVVVMSEGYEAYQSALERNGCAFVTFNESVNYVDEADDMSIDVQVGPNKDEITVSEDPQEVNPVDAVKRQYDSVVVAKDDKNFFMDVEDVQKCAELNCESVIDTANHIIDLHEDFDMNVENTIFVCSHGMNTDTYTDLCEAGAIVVFESKDEEQAVRKRKIQKMATLIKRFLLDKGSTRSTTSTFYIGGENQKFVEGHGKTILIRIMSKSSYVYGTSGDVYVDTTNDNKNIEDAIKIINDNRKELISEIEDEFSEYKVSTLRVQEGRLGVINVAVTFK